MREVKTKHAKQKYSDLRPKLERLHSYVAGGICTYRLGDVTHALLVVLGDSGPLRVLGVLLHTLGEGDACRRMHVVSDLVTVPDLRGVCARVREGLCRSGLQIWSWDTVQRITQLGNESTTATVINHSLHSIFDPTLLTI